MTGKRHTLSGKQLMDDATSMVRVRNWLYPELAKYGYTEQDFADEPVMVLEHVSREKALELLLDPKINPPTRIRAVEMVFKMIAMHRAMYPDLKAQEAEKAFRQRYQPPTLPEGDPA